MQVRLTLECLTPAPRIPLNYQYELSAWIYRVLREADAGYARFLHDEGYSYDGRAFKLFCFSNLDIPAYRIEGDRLHILCSEVFLLVRFCTFNTVEGFVEGLFYRQKFWLGDQHSRIYFQVKRIEANPLDLPEGSEPLRVRIRTRSPLLIARKRADSNCDEYLPPDDPDFGTLLIENLLGKYRAFTQGDPFERWQLSDIAFRLCPDRQARSKLVTLKSGTRQQTRVRGWMMDFEITAPRELIAIGMLAGWGRANSQGFGFGDILPPQKAPAPASTTVRKVSS